ncbi:MAG: hypothetical protein HY290_02490 [Planctomycetia bacterium]|nr:hypothetical protein [Planctomycetia bacterium]
MPRPQVVLNVHGGIVQDVFSSIPELQVVVVDWDTGEDMNPAQVDLVLDGRACSATVIDMPHSPLEELAGSDVEQAIDAACEQGVLYDTIIGSDSVFPSDNSISQKSTRHVVYDPDSDRLVSTEVFPSCAEAAVWAARLNDVLILPIAVPTAQDAEYPEVVFADET